MSGAAGRILHIQDNHDLTFVELKEILTLASNGKLRHATEKFDGVNLVFTWDGSGLRVARNGSDISSGGMGIIELAARFAGRDHLEASLTSAFEVVARALASLTADSLSRIFEDGKRWRSMEVICSRCPNVLAYHGDHIIFHSWPIFVRGSAHQPSRDDHDELTEHLEVMNDVISPSGWKIHGPARFDVKLPDDRIIKRVTERISAIMEMSGMSDDMRIEDRLIRHIGSYVRGSLIPHPVVDDVIMRIVGVEGAPTLTEIKRKLRKGEIPQVQECVRLGPKMMKLAVGPLERVVNDLAINLFDEVSSALISDPRSERKRLRIEFDHSLRLIRSAGNEEAKAILAEQLLRVDSRRNFAALEGIVFEHRDVTYKLTGNFSVLNQVIGLVKYGRGKARVSPR